MENKRQEGASPSSSSINFDHLFGPKDSSSSSSSSTGVFSSIFSPPSTVQGRGSSHSGSIIGSLRKAGESSKGGESNNIFNSKDKSSIYQNESAEPCNFSSSIYYGGQENYSTRTKATTESHHHVIKKDGEEDDPNGSNSNGASRGNWWQGSLYY